MHVEHKHPKPTASSEAAPLWASDSPFFCSAKRDNRIKLKKFATCL